MRRVDGGNCKYGKEVYNWFWEKEKRTWRFSCKWKTKAWGKERLR